VKFLAPDQYDVIEPQQSQQESQFLAPGQYEIVDSQQQEQMPQQQQSQPQESWPQSIGRNLGSGLIKAGSSALGLPRQIADLIGDVQYQGERQLQGASNEDIKKERDFINKEVPKLPSSEDIQNKTVEKLGLGKDFLRPKNTAEKVIQGTTELLPAALINPGKGLERVYKALTSAFGSTVGKEVASSVGLGDTGQAIGSILGGLGASSIRGGGTKGIVNKIPQVRENAYDTAEKVGKNVFIDAKPIHNALVALENPSKDNIGPAYQKYYKMLLHDINTFKNSMNTGGRTSVNNLVSLQKKLNNEIYGKNTPIRVKNAFSDVANVVRKSLYELESVHPEWGKNFRSAENLTQFIKGSKEFESFFRKHRDLRDKFDELPSAIKDVILDGVVIASGTKGAALKGATKSWNYGVKKYSQYRELMNNPETRKFVGDLWSGIAQDNTALALNAISKLK